MPEAEDCCRIYTRALFGTKLLTKENVPEAALENDQPEREDDGLPEPRMPSPEEVEVGRDGDEADDGEEEFEACHRWYIKLPVKAVYTDKCFAACSHCVPF